MRVQTTSLISALAIFGALALVCVSSASASRASGSRVAAAPSCGSTLATGAVPAGGSAGTFCVTGAVWVDQAAVFGSVVIEPGGSFYVGYPPDESSGGDCTNGWDGKIKVTGKLTVDAGGSLLMNSSVSCSDGGPTEIDTGGGIVNNGTVLATAAGQLGTAMWANGGQRIIGGSFLNQGTVKVDDPLTLTGRGIFQNEGSIVVSTASAPQGQVPESVTVAPPAAGGGPLSFVNGPGGLINLEGWHSGNQYVAGTFTVDAPNTFTEAGGKTKGAPVFDNGGALVYKGTGGTTIGITGSAAISGTIPAGSVLALSDPTGGGSEACGGAPFVDTAPSGLTIAKGATLIGYGSAPCSSGSSTTLKLGAGKSLVNNGTIIGGICGNSWTLLPGVYGKPNVFCVGGPNIYLGKGLNNGKIQVVSGITVSFSSLGNYTASTHKLKGGSYLVQGMLTVGGVTVLPR
jgi:hypothetical protein